MIHQVKRERQRDKKDRQREKREKGERQKERSSFLLLAVALPDDHSLHVTLSTHQKNTWGDLLEKIIRHRIMF